MDKIKFWICPHLVRPIHPIKDIKAFWYFYRLIKAERYDIVHTHETKSSLIARLAAYFAGCRYIIYGLHGVTFNDPLSLLRRAFYVWIERLTIGVSDLVVAVSQSVIDEYHRHNIGTTVPYRVVYSGVDVSYFEKKRIDSPEKRSQLRKSLGIKDADLLIANMGRFSHSKAQRFTIEAFARLKEKHSSLKLLLVGEGELKEDCQRLAKKLGVSEDTIFYGFSDNVPEVLSLSDLHLLTSLREGLPRAVVESYLCRVPVVAFEVEGIHEIIEDTVTGFVVPQYDIAALAEQASILISDATLRQRFGELGYSRAAERWDQREMLQNLRTIYNTTPPMATLEQL